MAVSQLSHFADNPVSVPVSHCFVHWTRTSCVQEIYVKRQELKVKGQIFSSWCRPLFPIFLPPLHLPQQGVAESCLWRGCLGHLLQPQHWRLPSFPTSSTLPTSGHTFVTSTAVRVRKAPWDDRKCCEKAIQNNFSYAYHASYLSCFHRHNHLRNFSPQKTLKSQQKRFGYKTE